MGPAMFPTLVGALLAGLGAIVTLRSFVLEGERVPRFFARPIGRLALRHRAVRRRAAMAWADRRGAVLVLVGALCRPRRAALGRMSRSRRS